MPTIQIRDLTLLERLKRIKPVPDDYYDDVIYELLKKAESKNEGRPSLRGLDELPRMIIEEIKKSLDGKLAEALQRALLPNIANLTIEVPVELSIRVRMRLEPVFDVAPSEAHSYRDGSSSNNDGVATPTNSAGIMDRMAELDTLERQVIELLRQRGGCWEGSLSGLVTHIKGRRDKGLEKRLTRRLVRRDGKICLPETQA